jgi:hypothetical protein
VFVDHRVDSDRAVDTSLALPSGIAGLWGSDLAGRNAAWFGLEPLLPLVTTKCRQLGLIGRRECGSGCSESATRWLIG